jgi:hypothetical protein
MIERILVCSSHDQEDPKLAGLDPPNFRMRKSLGRRFLFFFEIFLGNFFLEIFFLKFFRENTERSGATSECGLNWTFYSRVNPP